ncbi:beta propeller repeat protein [Aquimarina mytili]|uniref:Uncharacterized protein n=1 Tax=Aquimarina mytili TaxID=874423 RepID=A0A937A1K8_9FLAO|nr:hypothetical protein [Aquimarina mytili]MBL0682744.1 hypothetical protein [Aquimarina mytili]
MKIQKEDLEDFKGHSIYKGIVRYNDLYYFLTTNDNNQEVRLFTLDREELGFDDISFNFISASVCYQPNEKFIALGTTGEVICIGGGEAGEESPIPISKGLLKEVRGIAQGKAFAVGSGRQAYCRDDADHWIRIDHTAQQFSKEIDPIDTCWESIDGFDEDDIYVAGWLGEIWHYNGKKWQLLESPTDLDLTRIRCADDGTVYACGQMGTLIKIENKKCSIIDQNLTEDTFYGMAWFQGKLYCSTMHNVYYYDGKNLKEVDFKKNRPNTFHQLSARDGILCSFGEKDVVEFNGKEWIAVLKIK